MWALVNKTPFVVDRTFARDRDGAEMLLVVAKASYRIAQSGSLDLAEVQEPIHHAPVFAGDPASSPLLHETDFYLGKPGTDIVLHGTAYAREGQPTVALEASMRVGALTKTIAVIGHRVWEKRGNALELGNPEPFVTMPVSYEHAYGGRDGAVFDAHNPVGTGFANKPENLPGKQAPNLERPGALVPRAGEHAKPVSFGPIARSWQPRLALAGTFDAAWKEQRMPLLPLDYDARHERCAPEDQQLAGYLQGGEPIELDQLTPGGKLRTAVPRVRLAMRTRIGGATVHHYPELHTLLIDPDGCRLVLTWHSAIPCHRRLYSLRRTIVEVQADG